MANGSCEKKRDWVLAALRAYEARLTRFAGRLLNDDEAARDVVQHVFLKLCDQQPELLQDRLPQWLFTACRHRAIDLLRSRTRTTPLDEPCAGRELDPAVAAEKQEAYHQINRLVGQLPPTQREAVLLWSEGFAYKQIARITDRTEGSIRLAVHRGLKQLRCDPSIRQLLGITTKEGEEKGEKEEKGKKNSGVGQGLP